MKKAKVVITQNADFDLKEIADWYNTKDKKLIWVFLKDFKEKVKYISVNPLACEVRYENFRIFKKISLWHSLFLQRTQKFN
ncbi:hypothetical protein [Chryseobacterium scophthalmum]|uniref:ParE toxin of type II toxin-antitoxin system, parDE n=1 Tax=Chryseobacterium scophthalmum TaxID=59733 RepID=A0A1N6IL69_9FLAO|nr:hypothetical protein [Chryseobacterium scophthalmum]SIO32729.1 hypothetical protein SAMN05421769_3511 [Chryseobacterium scophthalmum]